MKTLTACTALLAAVSLSACQPPADGAESADAGATTDGVRVRIMRLYMAQHHVTKIPVAVYEVTPGTAAPFLIRSQPANMNWNGTENEAYAGYSRAIEGANQQLIERLNADCKR